MFLWLLQNNVWQSFGVSFWNVFARQLITMPNFFFSLQPLSFQRPKCIVTILKHKMPYLAQNYWQLVLILWQHIDHRWIFIIVLFGVRKFGKSNNTTQSFCTPPAAKEHRSRELVEQVNSHLTIATDEGWKATISSVKLNSTGLRKLVVYLIRILQHLSSDENTSSLRRTSEAGKASSTSLEVPLRSDSFHFLCRFSHGATWNRRRSKTRQKLRFWEWKLCRGRIDFYWWKCQL